jgi:hypothetical protein
MRMGLRQCCVIVPGPEGKIALESAGSGLADVKRPKAPVL